MASATELVFRTHTFKIARRGLSVMGATGPRSYIEEADEALDAIGSAQHLKDQQAETRAKSGRT